MPRVKAKKPFSLMGIPIAKGEEITLNKLQMHTYRKFIEAVDAGGNEPPKAFICCRLCGRNEEVPMDGFGWTTVEVGGGCDSCNKMLEKDPKKLLENAVKLTKGLGPAKAESIWEAHGAGWSKADLADMKGVTDEIKASWAETISHLNINAETKENN